MVERFEEGLRRFKDSEEKATLLRLHVRFLKYRMATRGAGDGGVANVPGGDGDGVSRRKPSRWRRS